MNADGIDIAGFRAKVNPEKLVRLADLAVKGSVSGTTAKAVLEEMYNTGKDPATILKEGERGQISDAGELERVAGQVIQANAQAVADYKAGKVQSLTF
jgi:aspartyl-tRNA(Asn)/glutamyl-tRNA(Gln) amidotransferase subunit B